MSCKLVLATHNDHKVEEITSIINKILGEDVSKFVSSSTSFNIEEPIEDGKNLVENSVIKAKAVFDKTNIPTLSDDSGIFVDILGNAPGIFSARWAGGHGNSEKNTSLLLDQLKDVPLKNRGAEFKAVVTIITDDKVVSKEGIVRGHLRFEKTGDKGFGYDPIFESDEIPGFTLAEVSPDEKNKISHRARALLALKDELVKIFE